VLTHGIRTIIIHNITSPKSKATVFSISNLAARWGVRIGYKKRAATLPARFERLPAKRGIGGKPGWGERQPLLLG
jgi:hypothetical protein